MFDGLGKNHFLNKPFGTGKGSVNKAGKDALGPIWDHGAAAGSIATGSLRPGFESAGKAVEGYKNSIGGIFDSVFGKDGRMPDKLSPAAVEAFMNKGEAKGQQIAGATLQEVGEGRKDVRNRLKQILEGDSPGASALRSSQSDRQKAMKSERALAGGGQMGDAMMQEQKRQADLDFANFVARERNQALTNLSREYRGAGSDIMQSTGQFGSILVGSQPAAMPQRSEGLITRVFGPLL